MWFQFYLVKTCRLMVLVQWCPPSGDLCWTQMGDFIAALAQTKALSSQESTAAELLTFNIFCLPHISLRVKGFKPAFSWQHGGAVVGTVTPQQSVCRFASCPGVFLYGVTQVSSQRPKTCRIGSVVTLTQA